VRQTTDFDELLTSNIDGMLIALPDYLHYEYAKKALLERVGPFLRSAARTQYAVGKRLPVVSVRRPGTMRLPERTRNWHAQDFIKLTSLVAASGL